jgi:pyrimidine deaminase RibD-like protein/NTP pyrophosphatase (non-canonical NTP hydrolase)
MDDERGFMLKAIDEARNSMPEDERPHPMVGVVVVKDNAEIAIAHRGEAPGDHGEFTALEKKLSDETIAGATVYVTLEPCSERNPPKLPCAKRLVERRVRRVVIGMLDPNPKIQGYGLTILDEAGIETALFPKDLADQVKELNREFIRAQKAQNAAPIVDPEFVKRYRERSLDEWYRILDGIYGDKNANRTAASIFTHLIEVVGGLSQIVSEKQEARPKPETFVPKALAWWMALCRKVYVKSVADMIWTKFPFVCPYCLRCPHDADVCNEKRNISPVPDWNALKQFVTDNRNRRPNSIGGWQRMFAAIYPVHDAERYGWTFARLTEELGELAEAVRIFDQAHGYFCNEAADVFAWLMHIQNLIERSSGTPTSERGRRLETDVCAAYPDRCLGCDKQRCICPRFVEATIERIAQELPAGPDLFEFGRGRP